MRRMAGDNPGGLGFRGGIGAALFLGGCGLRVFAFGGPGDWVAIAKYGNELRNRPPKQTILLVGSNKFFIG